MFSVLKNGCSFLMLLFFLSGCTTQNLNVIPSNSSQQTPVTINAMGNADRSGGSEKTPVPINEMDNQEAPPPLSLGSLNPPYSIHPGDVLDIKFFYNKELSESVTVRPDGRISLQLVHDVQAAALSPNDLIAVLKRKYSSHLKNPEISVIVRSFEASKVFVDGEVGLPGMVEMPGGELTIMQAIARARGLRDTAKRHDVLLIRRNGLKRPFVYTVNLGAAMAGTDITQNVILRPYDIVYVPKSIIANVNQWVDQYIRQNIPINVGYDLDNVIEIK